MKENEIGGACGTYGREERCIQGFCGTPEGKSPLERPRHKWETIIKMYLQNVGWGHGLY
jgi:hypothetical protein